MKLKALCNFLVFVYKLWSLILIVITSTIDRHRNIPVLVRRNNLTKSFCIKFPLHLVSWKKEKNKSIQPNNCTLGNFLLYQHSDTEECMYMYACALESTVQIFCANCCNTSITGLVLMMGSQCFGTLVHSLRNPIRSPLNI